MNLWLLAKSLLAALLMPGTVVGLVPYLIVHGSGTPAWSPERMPWTLIGLPPGVVGLVILVGAIVEFAAHGQGTLAPVDPPKVLILQGLYQRTRNPMYVGVLCILVAEAIVFGNFALLLYAVVIFILFHLFVLFYEEPHLRRKYGKPYEEYCKRVPRWPLPVRRRSEEGTGAR